MSKKEPPESRVGIFWLYNGKMYPAVRSRAVWRSLGHAAGHIDHWTGLHQRGAVPIEIEYEEPPLMREQLIPS